MSAPRPLSQQSRHDRRLADDSQFRAEYEAALVSILADYAITTRTAQPRRVQPGEIASRLQMEMPAMSRAQAPPSEAVTSDDDQRA